MNEHTRTGPALEKARYERTRVAVTRGPDTGLVVEAPEQRVLSDGLVALDVGVLVDGRLVDGDQRPSTVSEGVERTGLDQ